MNSRHVILGRLLLGACLTLLAASSVRAELFGLPNGRSADTAALPPLSVEAAFNTGDDYQNLGVRVNYQLSSALVLFADAGLVDFGPGFDDATGPGFGIGLFYNLANQRISSRVDIGAKTSFHSISLDNDSDVAGSEDIDGTNISLEVLVSGREPLTDGGLGWYANGGFNILGGDFDDTEVLLGGGVLMAAGPGEFYAGADIVDELIFGIGYRYFVQ